MRVNDTLLGLGFAALAAWIWWLTSFFPGFPGQDYGPDLFPRILATGIGVCALLLVLRGLRARRPVLSADTWAFDPTRLMAVLAVPVAVLFYIFVSDALGFIPTSLLILGTLGLLYGARPLAAFLTATGMTLVLHWFFVSLMRVPLPRGLMDPFL